MTELNPQHFKTEIIRWFEKTIVPASDPAAFDVLDTEKVLRLFRTDYHRYFPDGKPCIENLLSRLELCGILMYRTAHELFISHHDEINADRFSNLGRIISGFEIYYSATIGEGLKINHGLGSVIGARCTIGNNALIHQGVTLGDRKGQRPELGNQVTVYAGAKILGGIKVGDGAVIGANCVCMNDVPPSAVMVGVPGKIIRNEQSTT